MRSACTVLAAALMSAACPSVPDDAGLRDGGSDADAGLDAGPEDAGPPPDQCPGDECATACAAPIGGVCLVRGATLEAETPFAVSLLATACQGSTCTRTVEPLCDVTVDGNTVHLGGFACWYRLDLGFCSEDCAGADGALCEIPGLAAGSYVLEVDRQQLPFEVPSTVDTVGETCVYPEL